MNCCKQEQATTKEYDKILTRIQVLEDGRMLAKEARNWKIEGQKKRITREEYRRLWNEFETGGFMAQKGLWNVAKEKILQDRGALPKEEGDMVSVHEENFQSSWLRKDVEGIEERKKDRKEKFGGEESKSETREVERKEEKTVVVERRCVDLFFPVMFLRNLVPWMIWEVSGILGKTFLSDSCGVFGVCACGFVVCACCY